MYLVDGSRYDDRGSELEQALLRAHERQIRPLCLCSGSGIPVYVARLGTRHVLKRMPLSGSRHSPACAHYDGLVASEPSEVLPKPAIYTDDQTGTTHLRLAFSLFDRDVEDSLPPVACRITTGAPHARVALSPGELIRFLWSRADLMRWHPSFEGKRTWGVVRSHLLQAAQGVFVGATSLADVLFVPETLVLKNIDAIDSRRERRLAASFEQTRARLPLWLLVGELKRLCTTSDGGIKATIKHLPDVSLLCSEHAHPSFDRLCRWHSEPRDAHTIVLATFRRKDRHCYQADTIDLMATSLRWLPIDRSSKPDHRRLHTFALVDLSMERNGAQLRREHAAGNPAVTSIEQTRHAPAE